MFLWRSLNNLPAKSEEAVMIGCAAILDDITPAANVPAATVGNATKLAVPTIDVSTVLPGIVIAGTLIEKQTDKI